MDFGFMRTLVYWLDEMVYPLIPSLYSVFYQLTTGQLFSDETVKSITSNIYILVSVIMLFTMGVELIQTIINPDRLTDTKKGTPALIKRLVIAMLLIVGIPIMFESLYSAQDKILNSGIIEKLIIGIEGKTPEDVSDERKNVAKKTGQYLAGAALNCTFYPVEGATSKYSDTSTIYNDMINKDIEKMSSIPDINEKFDEDKYVFRFEKLASLAAGIFIVYILILDCFDMALRLAKLAFYQVTAPFAVGLYIFNGESKLQQWFKEVMSTFASVFIKIIILSFLVVGIQQAQEYISKNVSKDNWLIQLFILCGLLMLAKQLPSMIKSLFGIDFQFKGGLKGRFNDMVGGNLANKGLNKAKGILGGAATAPIAAAAGGIGFGLKKGAKKLDDITGNKVTRFGSKVKNSGFGRHAGRIGSTVKEGVKAGGGIKTAEAMKKTWKDNEFTKAKALDAEHAKAADALKRIQTAQGLNENDKIKALLETTNEINDNMTKKEKNDKQEERIKIANAAISEASIEKALNESRVRGVERKVVKELIKENEKKEKINAIKNTHEKVVDSLKELASMPNLSYDSEKKLRSLSNDYAAGNVSASNMAKELAELVNNGSIIETDAKSIMKNIDRVNSMAKEFGASIDLNTNGEKISASALTTALNNIEKTQADAKAHYDAMAGNANAGVKQDMESIINISTNVQKQYIAETKKSNTYSEHSVSTYTNDGSGVVNLANATAQFSSLLTPQPQQQTQTQQSQTQQAQQQMQSPLGQSFNGGTINVQSINTNELNANNFNTQNMNANHVDASSFNGNMDNLSDNILGNIKDNLASGTNPDDMIDAINKVNETMKDNYNNQNYDQTYENGDFDVENHDNNSFDDTFYEDLFDFQRENSNKEDNHE